MVFSFWRTNTFWDCTKLESRATHIFVGLTDGEMFHAPWPALQGQSLPLIAYKNSQWFQPVASHKSTTYTQFMYWFYEVMHACIYASNKIYLNYVFPPIKWLCLHTNDVFTVLA